MTLRATPRLATAFLISVIALVAAVIVGLPEVAVLAAPWFIAAAVAVGRGLDRSARVGVAVDHHRVMQGDDVELSYSVVSTTPAFLSVRARPVQRFRDRPASADVPLPGLDVVRAGRPTQVQVPVTLEEWGTWDLGSATVSMQDPLGFFRLDGVVRGDHEVRVHPPTERLRSLVRPQTVRRVTGAHPSRVAGRGVEYADIRAFQSGDSLRDINWRASARTGDLQVSERHPDRSADVVLLLDSFVESGHDLERVLGMAVRACLAVGEGHLAVIDRVGLVELGGVIRWLEPGTGGVQLHRLTDALLASSMFANAAGKELPTLSPRLWSPRAVVVALTPLLDERFVEALLVARSRGHEVAVIECSPFEPPEYRTPIESLALRLWLAERASVRDRLAEHGVAVALWRPGQPVELALEQIARRRQRVQVRAR